MMVVLADELWAAMAMLTTRLRSRLAFLSSFLWSDGIWSSGRPSGYSLVRRMGGPPPAALKCRVMDAVLQGKAIIMECIFPAWAARRTSW